MADFLYSIDLGVFYFFNHNLSLPLLDKFFVFITEAKHWMITYVVLWGIVFFKGGKRGKIIAVVSLLVITVSDQLSSFVVKNLFGRIRPCNALPDVKILAGCTDSFSFPSSHAVNNFAIAVFITNTLLKQRNKGYNYNEKVRVANLYTVHATKIDK